MQNTTVLADLSEVEELEDLQAPGFWEGVALGGAFGAALGTGIGIGLAIT
ncbi:hypothetical protein GCM10009759_42740 [Kitasatospora saccharophila]|uniref:Lactobin A/cerein 7B family class IIb bacteriocin n=1 Tax=Kitasatospora saccharophila TaxID=407973 RepID=A0ABN2X6W8_9ACTN